LSVRSLNHLNKIIQIISFLFAIPENKLAQISKQISDIYTICKNMLSGGNNSAKFTILTNQFSYLIY
jgi:flagellin-specific chaperone FliS